MQNIVNVVQKMTTKCASDGCKSDSESQTEDCGWMHLKVCILCKKCVENVHNGTGQNSMQQDGAHL